MGNNLIGFLGWVGLTLIAAAIAAAASLDAAAFYSALVRPSWAPPSWVFGPVWTVLYVMMGLAAGLVWRARETRPVRAALVLFVAQLCLNAAWSWFFFGWHLGAVSFIDIVVLWVLLVVTCILFWRANWIAGALLIPYLLWVSFAAALNFAVWRLNPLL